jgi:hypothetical protein
MSLLLLQLLNSGGFTTETVYSPGHRTASISSLGGLSETRRLGDAIPARRHIKAGYSGGTRPGGCALSGRSWRAIAAMLGVPFSTVIEACRANSPGSGLHKAKIKRKSTLKQAIRSAFRGVLGCAGSHGAVRLPACHPPFIARRKWIGLPASKSLTECNNSRNIGV